MPLFLGAILGAATAQAQVEISMAPQGGAAIIALGDTVTFEVLIDAKGAQVTAFEFYQTFDPTVFEPLFADIDTSISEEDTVIVYRPFTAGNLIALGPPLNTTRGDVWSDPYDDLNGIPGFQLDYFQATPAAPAGGIRESFSGSGVAATFDLLVMSVPDDPNGLARITFDYQNVVPGGGDRRTRYFLLGSGGIPSDFSFLPTMEILVAGLKIQPTIPDTIIAPGSALSIYLSDHFTSGLYDSSQAVWTVTQNSVPAGATVVYDAGRDVDSVFINTVGGTQGIVDLTITLESPEATPLYTDVQQLEIIVDFPPVFAPPFPALVFDEDDSLVVAAAAIFSDADDPASAMTVELAPSSPVMVRYDDVAATLTFSADTNWFGSQTALLSIEDGLGVGIDTTLSFTVNAVNDSPVVDLTALGDTVIIHRDYADTLALGGLVTDVDNLALTLSVSDPDPVNLSVTLLAGDNLRLAGFDTSAFTDIDVVITATDSLGAFGRDTLVVSIRSWPPEIGGLPELKLLAGTPETLELNPLVSDNDTPDGAMTWSFAVLDFATLLPDMQVMTNYDPASQTVIFTTPANYAASDWLRMTVTDDDNNTAVDSTRLTVFASFDPVIDPLDTVVVFRDSSTNVLDLDDFVTDPIYGDADISWSFTGGDSLQDVQIGSDHVLTIVTDPNFFGWDSLTFVATNPDSFSDTTGLVVRVIPRTDGPPLWVPLDVVEIVFPDVIDLFALPDVVKDDFTEGNQLIYIGTVNPNPATPLNLVIDPITLVASISVPALAVYDTWLFFSAEDNMGQVSFSDTMIVSVKDSYSPVWSQPPTVALQTNETFTGLLLQDYISDRDTPLSALTITFVNPNPLITVTYDAATTEVTITASGVASESRITFTATDPEGNTNVIELRVLVRAIIDFDPPEGGLTYYFNPVADKWVHFVLVSDSTATRFHTTFIYNSRAVTLSFTQLDSLPGTMTWTAPYRFALPGIYDLTAELIDGANNINRIPLRLSVTFSKTKGDRLASADQRLTVTYPPTTGGEGKLMILSERPMTEGLRAAMGPSRDEPHADEIGQKIYSLKTNLAESMLVTLAYQQWSADDPYFSFYRVVEGRLEPIDTYIGKGGQFEAALVMGPDIVFGRSETPASNTPLPSDELICYPNPFNAVIAVQFMLRVEDRGRIAIYDLQGREVYATPHRYYPPGLHQLTWSGVDGRGATVPSGIYFVRLMTDGGRQDIRKVTLLK